MTAEQMFEELGYSVEENPNYHRGPNYTYIYKSYIVAGLVHSERDRIRFYKGETYDATCNITMELHKAVCQQLKEFGWDYE